MSDGPLIRHKKIIEGVRLGGAEIYRIVAETNEFVIYGAWAQDGRAFGESVLSKNKFEETFELVPEDLYAVEQSRRGWRLTRRTSGRLGDVRVEITTYEDAEVARRAAAALNYLIDKEVNL